MRGKSRQARTGPRLLAFPVKKSPGCAYMRGGKVNTRTGEETYGVVIV